MNKQSPARRVAITGTLFALALVLGFVENLIAPLFGLPPGVKLGLANIVVMYALLFLSRRQALLLVVLKAAFGALTRGPVAGVMSLSGGLLSLLVMVLLLLPRNKPSVLVVSIGGSLFHNLGQLAAIYFMLGSAVFVYTPVLLVSGIVFGVLTSLVLRVLMPALHRTGIYTPDEYTKNQNRNDAD